MRQISFLFLLFGLLVTPAFAVDWNNPDSVVQLAISKNPSLAKLSAQLQAARERVIPAASLPNPMVMGGVQNRAIDLSYDSMTMYMVGASQTLVRRARRDALRRSAELEVDGLQRQIEARKAEIERDVRVAWLDAASAENRLTATAEISRLVKSVTGATRIRYETGAVPQADLIRAMLEESTIEHQIILVRRQRNAALARLLPLLQLPADRSVPDFALEPKMDRAQAHGVDAPLPEVTPSVAALQTEVARAEEDVELARLAAKPDVNLEAQYGFRPRAVDMFSVVARVELPLRRSTVIAPRIREAVARREAAQQQIETLRLQLRQDLGTATVLRNEAIEQINLHVEKLVPAAKLGFESTLLSYQNGKTSLDGVLGSLRTYLSLNVDYYDFLRQQLAAEADIHAIRQGARSGTGSIQPGPAMN